MGGIMFNRIVDKLIDAILECLFMVTVVLVSIIGTLIVGL
jgi:hypothetical protein